MRIHGVLLTGGQSSRMGQDKAGIKLGDQTMAERIAAELGKVCCRITVLGPNPIRGATDHLPDEERYPGPLVAISRIQTDADAIFLASCDLPTFEAGLINSLSVDLGGCDAIIPILEGRQQPLCGLYRAQALEVARGLAQQGERRIMAWISALDAKFVDLTDTPRASMVRNANTQAELNKALGEEPR